LASEALAGSQSWVLIKSLTEKVRLKSRFKYRQWVSADYCLRQWVPDSWCRTTKGSSRKACPVVGPQTSEVSIHWCDDLGMSVLWRCCDSWRSTQSPYTWFCIEWATNAARAVMAGHEIVLEPSKFFHHRVASAKNCRFHAPQPTFLFPLEMPLWLSRNMLHGWKDNSMLAKPLAACTYPSSIVSELYDA